MPEKLLEEVKNNLIDLYLKVKIRKTIETITIDSDFLDNEKKNLSILSPLDIIIYIKTHLQILIDIQVSEKLNELRNNPLLINEQYGINCSENNYETLLRRYEGDIRNYIKIENMLKIHIDDLNYKIEQLEKTIENLRNKNLPINNNILEYQKKIDNLTTIVKNYEKSNLIIPELEKKIKFQKIELDKMDEYYKNKIKSFNKKIEKYEKNENKDNSFNTKKIQISNYNSYKTNTNNNINSNINNNNTTLKKKKKLHNSIISNNDSSFLMITNNNFYNSPKFNTMTQRSLYNYDSCDKDKSTDYFSSNKTLNKNIKNNFSSSKKNNVTKKMILQNKSSNICKKRIQKIPKSTSNIISKKNSIIIDKYNNNYINQLISNKNKKIRLNKSNSNSNICRDLNTTLSNITIEKIPSCVNYINIYSTLNNNNNNKTINNNKNNNKLNENNIIGNSNLKRSSTEKKYPNEKLNKSLLPRKKSNSRSKTKSFVNKYN